MRWKHLADPRNTSTKRFPIFSLRKIRSIREPRGFLGAREIETCRATVTTPNNFPWSYFHNKKLQIGFPLTRASICRLRASLSLSLVASSPPPCSFLFPSIRFLSSPSVLFDSFRRGSRSVTFQSVLAVPGPYQLYYVSALSSFHHSRQWRRIGAVCCSAWDKIYEETWEKGAAIKGTNVWVLIV